METKDTISIAHHFGLPLFDIARFDTSTIPSHLLQNPIFQRHDALPLFTVDENCYVAITDPTLPDLNEITFTGRAVKPGHLWRGYMLNAGRF